MVHQHRFFNFGGAQSIFPECAVVNNNGFARTTPVVGITPATVELWESTCFSDRGCLRRYSESLSQRTASGNAAVIHGDSPLR